MDTCATHIHRDDPQTIYLCLEHGGIVRSFDRGASWEDVSKGIDYLDIHVIANFTARTDRYYVASARGFFTSDQPEDGWVRAENRMTHDYFHDFLFFDPRRNGDNATMLIAAAERIAGLLAERKPRSRGAIFKSPDSAESWNRITNGLADDLDQSSGRWLITQPITSRSSPASATSPVATPQAPTALAIL